MKNLQNLSESKGKNESAIKLRSNSSTYSKPLKIKTPHIDLFNIRELKIADQENVMKNFSQMAKQIIDTKNANFLNGDINLIEYILSKYTTIPLENVREIERLSLKVNFEYALLNQFGQYLPKIKELKLNNSIIPSFSDIGSSFTNLKELYISSVGLKDLNGINYCYSYIIGIICFQNLELMDASNNELEDLQDIDMTTSIIKLNFRNNKLKSLDNLDYLSYLPSLTWINLNENPIQMEDNYSFIVRDKLSEAQTIDKDEEWDMRIDTSTDLSKTMDFKKSIDLGNL